MNPDLHIGIAAYNEENHIDTCLDSLSRQNFSGALETIVCLNGCTDKTEKKVLSAKKRYPDLNIELIHSPKGISFAQSSIVNQIHSSKSPLLFVDADVTLDSDCSQILYDELERNSSLVVAGAWPIPRRSDNMSLWESILFDVLHVRAHYPESEISANDVTKFKSFVDSFPQPGISPDFEKKSKIYFHGRAFMVRKPELYDIPTRDDVCDDTYMPNLIHTEHGPGTIRTRYDANVFYDPYISLVNHFKIYRRVFLDLWNIDEHNDKFVDSREMERTKLDWRYILNQKPEVISKFLAYSLITKTEKMCYSVMPKKGLSELWEYRKK